MTASDRRMATVLLKLELLGAGSTQAWNPSGGQSGKPDDKFVAIVARGEQPIHLHYRERYERAHSERSKAEVIAEAEEVARDWAVRSKDAQRVAEGAILTTEELIIQFHVGQSAEVVAFQFNMHPDMVRRIRKRKQVGTEDGRPLLGDGDDTSDRVLAAAELRRRGLSQTQIAKTLNVSQPTVHRLLKEHRFRRSSE